MSRPVADFLRKVSRLTDTAIRLQWRVKQKAPAP